MKLILFSDIHSNFVALQACLAEIKKEKFDRLCMLGDIIAYGPRPRECCETLMALEGALCLKGNHDENVLRQGIPRGVSPEIGRFEILDRAGLGSEVLAWLEGLSPVKNEGEYCFVHASPARPYDEYVIDEKSCRGALESVKSHVVFCGHSHVPLWYSLSAKGAGRLERPKGDSVSYALNAHERHVVNVGSVGNPRDGDPRACYVVFDTESWSLEFRRVAYDRKAMADDMKNLGFPEELWRKT